MKLELLEKRTQLIDEMKSIISTAEEHKRSMIEPEENRFNEIEKQIEQIDNQIRNNQNNNNNQNQKTIKMNSLFKNLINTHKGELDQNEIKSQLRASGIAVQDAEYVMNVRALTPVSGETLVPTTVMDLSPILTEGSLISKISGNFVSIPAEVAIPDLGRGTLSWEDDGDEVTNNNFTVSANKLLLNRLSGAFPVDKKISKVVSPSYESAITNSIYSLADEKITEKLFTNISAATAITGTSNFEILVAAEATLLAQHVPQSSLVYVYNPADLPKLKARGKKANEILMPILDDNKIGGYNAYPSTYCPSGKVLMISGKAVWANLPYTGLLYDPYTLAGKGQDRVVINAYGDANISNINYAVFATLV